MNASSTRSDTSPAASADRIESVQEKLLKGLQVSSESLIKTTWQTLRRPAGRSTAVGRQPEKVVTDVKDETL